jgi:hypothetical protein
MASEAGSPNRCRNFGAFPPYELRFTVTLREYHVRRNP